MTDSWTFAVARDDLTRTTVHPHASPTPAAGEAVLRVDRVGMTANNVTYAVLGDSLRYWEFFPPDGRGLPSPWGIVPVWGFAEVVASTVDTVPVGQRVYGYLPSAGHLLVRPGHIDERGFRDESTHRSALPSVYNRYAWTANDAAYDPAHEDLLVLYRPLFVTSYMLADQIEDNGFYGCDAVVISSASSKTAYGVAFELHGKGPRVIGLTSVANLDFTRGLGCYDDVRSYEQVSALDASRQTIYVDVAGRADLRAALRQHLADRLARDISVGLTNQRPDFENAGEFFFAPTQLRRRSEQWGRDGLDARLAEAWRRFVVTVQDWVDVTTRHGAEGLRDAWLEVLAGRTPPRVGHVITLPTPPLPSPPSR